MAYVEESMTPGTPLTEYFIRELHTLTVRELVREGDSTPGAYRKTPVRIARSGHVPPEAIRVPEYMQELVAFVNEKHGRKYDLIKVALSHHRFSWIHPFSNGNGRVVRLITYALLIKYGFNVQAGGRVLNPTAVFCNDRDRYYAMLARADTGTSQGLEEWCNYVLQGILDELRKVDRLTDYEYLSETILIPTLVHAKERRLVTALEDVVLRIVTKKGVAKAADFAAGLSGMTASQRTYQIRKLVERKILQPIRPEARQYTLGFSNSDLMRGIIYHLSKEGFIPQSLRPVP